jgi:hypothetical protein
MQTQISYCEQPLRWKQYIRHSVRVFSPFRATAQAAAERGGVRQFESLLDLQIRQAFDFEDAAREDVLILFFSTDVSGRDR